MKGEKLRYRFAATGRFTRFLTGMEVEPIPKFFFSHYEAFCWHARPAGIQCFRAFLDAHLHAGGSKRFGA